MSAEASTAAPPAVAGGDTHGRLGCRAKLYELNSDRDWVEMGLARVTVTHIEAAGGDCIKVTAEDGSDLLVSKVRQDDFGSYQRKENILTWTEISEPNTASTGAEGSAGATRDLALSFETTAGCDSIWQALTDGNDGFNLDLWAREQMDEKGNAVEGGSAVSGTVLPEVSEDNLQEVLDTFCQADAQQRPGLTKQVMKHGGAYLTGLFGVFDQLERRLGGAEAEAPRTEEARAVLLLLGQVSQILRAIVLLNVQPLMEMLLTDEVFPRVAGIFEYDGKLKRRARYRAFLRDSAKLKEVVPLEDAELRRKITQTYRARMLKETMVRPLVDEAGTGAVNAFITGNSADIAERISENLDLLRGVVAILQPPLLRNATRREGASDREQLVRCRDALRMLLELLHLSKCMYPLARGKLLQSLFEDLPLTGYLGALLTSHPGGDLRLLASELLFLAALFHPTLLSHDSLRAKPPPPLPVELLAGADARPPAAAEPPPPPGAEPPSAPPAGAEEAAEGPQRPQRARKRPGAARRGKAEGKEEGAGGEKGTGGDVALSDAALAVSAIAKSLQERKGGERGGAAFALDRLSEGDRLAVLSQGNISALLLAAYDAKREERPSAIFGLARCLDTSRDEGVLVQCYEALRLVLDADGAEPTEREGFLRFLYEHHMEWLMLPLLRYSPSAPTRGGSVQQWRPLYYCLHLLGTCVHHHTQRVRSLLHRAPLLQRAAAVIEFCPDGATKLAALSFLRECVETRDSAIARSVVQGGALVAAVSILHRQYQRRRDGLLTSAVADLVDIVRRGNMATLIAHLVERGREVLSKWAARGVPAFKQLLQRYEQLRLRGDDLIEPNAPPAAAPRRLLQDDEDEEYLTCGAAAVGAAHAAAAGAEGAPAGGLLCRPALAGLAHAVGGEMAPLRPEYAAEGEGESGGGGEGLSGEALGLAGGLLCGGAQSDCSNDSGSDVSRGGDDDDSASETGSTSERESDASVSDISTVALSSGDESSASSKYSLGSSSEEEGGGNDSDVSDDSLPDVPLRQRADRVSISHGKVKYADQRRLGSVRLGLLQRHAPPSPPNLVGLVDGPWSAARVNRLVDLKRTRRQADDPREEPLRRSRSMSLPPAMVPPKSIKKNPNQKHSVMDGHETDQDDDDFRPRMPSRRREAEEDDGFVGKKMKPLHRRRRAAVVGANPPPVAGSRVHSFNIGTMRRSSTSKRRRFNQPKSG